ncbi:MAG: type B 50S ribosomal protein L31 [Bacteriovoracaceae bacterium]|jgi:large subunit ribosomal protein L31|nr:50S ribosomal protein L31 [Halobacteriovoraceae bacterium]MDP7320472.1 type B 50S ribosomal protein L31 [Bacteriovoracaceae bacterium]|tara:strand:- start:1897 stop:2151 length:255 start_codon:yes stop_codon:yes gene_type:complete
MKKDIHPEYREVLFHDISVDFKVLTRSTIATKETIEWEGKTVPYIKVDISSASHPFYTGTQKILDTEGRVEKFNKKFRTRKIRS